MRDLRRRCVLAFGSLAASIAGAGDVQAFGLFHDRDVNVAPTAYVVETVPTSYLVPTVYVPTSYVLSPSYSYVVPTSSRRRYVATSYEVLPTVLPTSYVTDELPVRVPSVVPSTQVYPTAHHSETSYSDPCDPCAVRPPPCCCATSSLAPRRPRPVGARC